MLAESTAPAGIRDGDPATLAHLCAAGGPAVIAYRAAAGGPTGRTDIVVMVLADFRSRVAKDGTYDSQLDSLLLTLTRAAVRSAAGVEAQPEREQAANEAFASAQVGSLAPDLARGIIGGLVDAAPVSALDGDRAAVREAAELIYRRDFESRGSVAPAAPPPPANGDVNPWLPAELPTRGGPAAGPEGSGESWHIPPPPGAPQTLESTPPPDTAPGRTAPARRRLLPHLPRLPRRVRGTFPGREVLLLAAVAVIAVTAVVMIGGRSEPSVQQGAILLRPLDVPFPAAGAVFDIARTRSAVWARDIRRRQPRAGHKWITLAAQTRNVRRANFHPRALGYRLRTNSGIVIGPEFASIPAPPFQSDGRLPPGKRTSVHLGFLVPNEQSELSLEFDPGSGSPRVRVPLN